ncbi:hypothetical protein LEMLEM_LOCUS15848, partial [Lemmus lemmus]
MLLPWWEKGCWGSTRPRGPGTKCHV